MFELLSDDNHPEGRVLYVNYLKPREIVNYINFLNPDMREAARIFFESEGLLKPEKNWKCCMISNENFFLLCKSDFILCTFVALDYWTHKIINFITVGYIFSCLVDFFDELKFLEIWSYHNFTWSYAKIYPTSIKLNTREEFCFWWRNELLVSAVCNRHKHKLTVLMCLKILLNVNIIGGCGTALPWTRPKNASNRRRVTTRAWDASRVWYHRKKFHAQI